MGASMIIIEEQLEELDSLLTKKQHVQQPAFDNLFLSIPDVHRSSPRGTPIYEGVHGYLPTQFGGLNRWKEGSSGEKDYARKGAWPGIKDRLQVDIYPLF